MNLVDKIQKPFAANPDLKILFFFDPDQEYKDQISDLEMDGITIIKADKAHFQLKIELEHELRDKKVLLYFPYARPDDSNKHDFILLDLLKANKELLLDNVADFMEEFHLLPHQRSVAQHYINDLKLKKHQKVLGSILTQHEFKEKNIIRGLICSYLEFNSVVDPALCLAKLFTLVLPENSEKFKQFEKRLKFDEVRSTLAGWFYHYIGLSTDVINHDVLLTAVKKMKYNLLVQHINQLDKDDQYAKLRIDDMMTLQLLRSIVDSWQNNPALGPMLDKVLKIAGKDVKEKQIVKLYGPNSDFQFHTNDLKYLILGHALKAVETNPESTLNILQKFSGDAAISIDLKTLMEFLGSAANFFNLLKTNAGYILDSPEEYISKYCSDYSKIDYYYRKIVDAREALQRLTLPDFIDTDPVMAKVHSSYESFLVELNREWLRLMKQSEFAFNQIDTPKQYQFYNSNIADADQKIAVIISDALRYEVAGELLGELLKDPKGDADLSCMISSVPSITKLGMASLLPNSKLDFDGPKLSIDGVSTEGTANRQKILQSVQAESIAVNYDKLMRMDRNASRELFKNQVVYIYHNTIDAIGDDRKSEMKTFSAVTQAINDLKTLVTKIHATYNVGKIFITADHGFLFNYNTLSDATFQKLPSGKHIEEHNRYIITQSETSSNDGYQFRLSNCTNMKSDLMVTIPKGINRYRRQGSGSHFVHGGASLQEMVLPLLISTRKRKDIGQKVSFKILNKDLKIVSGAIKIRVHQDQPISSEIKSRIITAGVYNMNGDIVSNEATTTFDSPSDLPTERTKEFILNLNSEASTEMNLSLKMFDLQDDPDRLNPVISENVINSTLIGSDF